MIIIPNSFYGRMVPGVFQRRLHRFAAEVETEEGIEVVHLPNSGRLRELLILGNQVGLSYEGHPGRKTRYTLVKVKVEAGWVFIDTRLPNRILAKHWRQLPPLCTYTEAHPERKWGGSRFDLALQGGESPDTAWLEAKCVTLVQDGIALFPDAPTERGQKHLLELTRIREEGSRSYVFFFLQHPGGKRIEAHREMDPQFAKAMVAAANVGVEFYGYRVLPGEDQVELTAVPVLIGDERN